MKLLLICLFNLLAIERAGAAACCGGGFATPSLIAGDDKAQFTSSLSSGQIYADVYTNGFWKKRETAESSQTLKLEGARIFNDRWQVGGSLPFIERARATERSTGLGDTSVLIGYEYLPDWSYHPIRPKGIGFIQLVLPTGRSVYEAEDEYGLDSRGRGFWALGIGTLLTKALQKFDLFLNAEIHSSFAKSVVQNGVDMHLQPGWGGNLAMGVGYNTAQFRFGGSLNWSYEDPIEVRGATYSAGALQRFATLGLTASYLMNDEWATTVSYADQTLMGSPYNTSLSKTVSLMLQKRWQR